MVSVYNRDVDDKHPLSTIEFTNLSGTALEEGPISVFFNKNFAGEAMIPFLETNAKGRIPYAIDQAVEVVRETSSTTSSFHQIVIKDYIYFKYYRTSTTIYKLKNFNENPRKVIVEHPKSKDYKLFENGGTRLKKRLPSINLQLSSRDLIMPNWKSKNGN